MHEDCTRRKVLGSVFAVMATFAAGCMQSNEIPLVQFPEGKAPPPPPKKDEPGGPQGSNTSKGEPIH